MIGTLWSESAEERRIRITLPGHHYANGECPYDCINLQAAGLVCGCDEHALTERRTDVVHLWDRHWNGSCAYAATHKKIEKLENELEAQKGALRIVLNTINGRPTFEGM